MRLALAVPILAASLVPSLASAQSEGAGAAELKPALGLTLTSLTKDPATGDTKAQAGWQIGGTVLVGRKLYFEGGAFYAKKSTEITAVGASTTVDFNGVTGVRVPAMIGYHVLNGSRDPLSVRLFGGGSAFFVTSVDAQGLSKSDLESPTWGVFAGAGIDFLFLFIDAKYEWSLNDFTSVSTVDVGQSRSFYLNAGVKLPI